MEEHSDFVEIHNEQVDVCKIMEEIERRVEDKKRSGLYSEKVEQQLLKQLSEDEADPTEFATPYQELYYNVHMANLTCHITSVYPISSRRPLIGPVLVFIKRLIRRIVRTYVDVIIQQQAKFNAYVVRSLNAFLKIIESQQQEPIRPDFNYFAFEEKHRGEDAWIREVQSQFLPYFKGCNNVVEIGCGRGVFLEILNGEGIRAIGVDTDANMIALCQRKGLNVRNEDAFNYLRSLSVETLDGVFAGQVIEHLSSNDLIGLIRLVYLKLKPGSYFIAETINPRCLSVFSGAFYVDPSHIRPVHPETIRFFLESVGFKEIEFKYLSPFPEDSKLQMLSVDGSLPEEQAANHKILNENFKKLNELLYGCQDYAVIARK